MIEEPKKIGAVVLLKAGSVATRVRPPEGAYNAWISDGLWYTWSSLMEGAVEVLSEGVDIPIPEPSTQGCVVKDATGRLFYRAVSDTDEGREKMHWWQPVDHWSCWGWADLEQPVEIVFPVRTVAYWVDGECPYCEKEDE